MISETNRQVHGPYVLKLRDQNRVKLEQQAGYII